MRRIFLIALLAASAVSSNALAARPRKPTSARKPARSPKPVEEAQPPESPKPVEEARPSEPSKPPAPVKPEATAVTPRPEGEKPQPTSTPAAREWGGGHVRFQQSLEDKRPAPKPAAFHLMFPGEGRPVSLNVDAALEATHVLLPGGSGDTGSPLRLEGGLGVEYHLKTDIPHPQNLLGAGVGLELSLAPRSQGESAPDALIANTVHTLQLNAQLKSDFQQNARASILAYLDYAPVNFLYSGRIVPNRAGADGSRWIAFSWLPTVGLEGEEILSTAGFLFRARGALDVSVYPAAGLLEQRLELNVVGELRYTFSSSSVGESWGDLNPLFKASARYYVDGKQRVSVGADYLNGSNPRFNLARQEFWQLGLRVQFPGRAE